MSATFGNFTQTIQVRATSAEAFRLFRHETALRDWLCERAVFNPRKNGEIFLLFPNGYTVTGKISQFVQDQLISFSWQTPPGSTDSKVEVAIIGKTEGAEITLTHHEPDQTARQKWPEWLENFQSVLETGVDLRLARRPRLGIMIDEFSAEIAKKLGVSVTQGLRIAGTVEGTGAREAGIFKDDVIISLNGVPVSDFDSLGIPLQSLRAGDSPEVSFYRGPVLHTVPLTLSSFPTFAIPTPIDLATRYRANAAEVRTAFEAILLDVTEHEASVQPAENEWSAREILAHFILCERDYQGWVADMVNDTVIEDWLQMRPNVTTRVQALAHRLGSLSALQVELAAAQEESADFLEHLPETFFNQRKHMYRRAAQWALEVVPSHYFDEHKEQLEHTLIKAKQ